MRTLMPDTTSAASAFGGKADVGKRPPNVRF